MRRFVITLSAVVAAGALLAGPAAAGQCPKLIKAINDEANKRLDSAAYDARQKAAQAQKLHDEKKHEESEKVAKEALAQLGVKM